MRPHRGWYEDVRLQDDRGLAIFRVRGHRRPAARASEAGGRKQPFASREAYVLRATPRRGYVPPTLEARALTGMQGTLWIDTETFQWMKVTADVTHPVSIEGVLAQVEPGTSFTLENVP